MPGLHWAVPSVPLDELVETVRGASHDVHIVSGMRTQAAAVTPGKHTYPAIYTPRPDLRTTVSGSRVQGTVTVKR